MKHAGLIVFFLTKGWAQLKLLEQARKLVGLRERIKETAAASKPGECFRVPASGTNLDKFKLE